MRRLAAVSMALGVAVGCGGIAEAPERATANDGAAAADQAHVPDGVVDAAGEPAGDTQGVPDGSPDAVEASDGGGEDASSDADASGPEDASNDVADGPVEPGEAEADAADAVLETDGAGEDADPSPDGDAPVDAQDAQGADSASDGHDEGDAVGDGAPVVCVAPSADCDGDGTCETVLATDPANCGACGAVCSSPNGVSLWIGGVCESVCGCGAGFANCDGTCANGCETNTSTSVADCGMCGFACTVAHGTPSCAAGTCVIASCDVGWADCDGLAVTGCETDLTTDANCGACGKNCVPPGWKGCLEPACVGGACQAWTCNFGWIDCDCTLVNGCETNFGTDLNNCGDCGVVCSAPHATPKCVGATCAIRSCDTGWSNCDGVFANGCEVNIAADPSSCGSCGVQCGPTLPHATAGCSSGVCSGPICDTGWANCDGVLANGCEANLTTDPGHCGTCGTQCPWTEGPPTCSAGVCRCFCSPGYANCDNDCANFCETNVNSNPSNCGACGYACSLPHATPACSAGSCTIATCDPGWASCNGVAFDGCETSTATDPAHCGTCGVTCTAPQICAGGVCG